MTVVVPAVTDWSRIISLTGYEVAPDTSYLDGGYFFLWFAGVRLSGM
jgi:hypothetical protein